MTSNRAPLPDRPRSDPDNASRLPAVFGRRPDGSDPFFYGWWLVGLACLVNGIGGGIFFQAFTVFFLPLKNDFAVSSTAVSLLYAAARLEGGLEGPLVGYLISRFGPRAMVIAGVCMSGGGLFLLALAPNYWTFFVVYVGIVSVGYNAGFFHPLSTLVNYWFVRQRGLGMSWISAAANVGGMLMAPLLSAIILGFGWRMGAMTAGAAILLICLPAALPLRSTPESMGLYPDGEPPGAITRGQPGGAVSSGEPEIAVRDALRSGTYWMLTGLISLRLFVTVALATHLVPIMVWGGMGEAAAAYMVSLYAFGSIVAMMALGWIGDRCNKARVSSLGLVPMILAMAGLVVSQAPVCRYGLALGLAVAMGTAPLNWALIGDLFGRRSYATLRGVMGVGYGTMTFLSPIYAGWLFDRTGSYASALLTFVLVAAAIAILFPLLPTPPIRTRSA